MPGLVSIGYDYAEVNVTNGQTNFSLKTNVAELFDNIKIARRVVIQSNKTISFRFNNISLPAISLLIGEGPYQLPENFLHVTDIFITNASGDTAALKVTLV